MSDLVAFLICDSTGAPNASATPSFDAYCDKTGAARTEPGIINLGGGLFGFVPTDEDREVGTCALVDCGSSSEPRRVSAAIHKATHQNQFWCVHFEDGAGDLWVGADPTVGSYRDPDGNTLTAPTPLAVAGDHLWAITPTAGDITDDASGRIDAPAGASPEYFAVEVSPVIVDTGPQPAPGPLRKCSTDVANYLHAAALEFDTTLLDLGTNLFIGQMLAQPEKTAAPAVFCLGTGGVAPVPYLQTGRTAFYRSMVQVMIRGPVDDNDAGETYANQVFATLHQAVPNGYTAWLCRESSPAFLGDDGDSHGQWVINVECSYVQTLD